MSSELAKWMNAEENGWQRVTLPHMVTKDNFVSGDPLGDRLRVQYFLDQKRQLKGKVWFGPGTQGPPGHAHGGSMAAVLDEAMGGAAWLAGHMVVAAEITISYREMLPLKTWCVIEPKVVEVDGRKVRTEAEVTDRDGHVYSTGRGLFITLDASMFGDMAARLSGMLGDESSSSGSSSASQQPKLDAETCLQPTDIIDADHPAIVQCLASLGIAGLSPSDRARALFEYVRDEVRYEFMAKLTREEYIASRVLTDRKGFCVQKAILLCALGRAADIPTALVLSDLRDHTLPTKIVSAIGTDVMHHHGLNAFYLDGQWVKVDASLSSELAKKKGCRLVEFDASGDALQATTTLAGEPHCEYLRFHGLFADLPFQQMMSAFFHAYQNADMAAVAELGLGPSHTTK